MSTFISNEVGYRCNICSFEWDGNAQHVCEYSEEDDDAEISSEEAKEPTLKKPRNKIEINSADE